MGLDFSNILATQKSGIILVVVFLGKAGVFDYTRKRGASHMDRHAQACLHTIHTYFMDIHLLVIQQRKRYCSFGRQHIYQYHFEYAT